MNESASSQSHAALGRYLWLADFSLLLVAIIWGVNIPVMKIALHRIDAYAFNAIRLVVSSIVLLYFAKRELLAGIKPSLFLQKRDVIIYACIVSVAYQFLFLLAIARATSADVALIMATVPMWTAIGARFFLKEFLPIMAWVGLIIAFAGTMIVTLHKVPIRPSVTDATISKTTVAGELPDSQIKTIPPATRLIGNFLALSAALAWASGTVFSRPLLGKISPIQLSACSATLGLPFHIVVAFWFGRNTLADSTAALREASLIACVLYSGTLSTGLALAMWSFGVKHAGAAQAAMIQNLTPVVAMAAAWIWLGETMNSTQALGGAMIIGGLIVMRRSSRIRDSRSN